MESDCWRYRASNAENAQTLCAEAGFAVETRIYPAEDIPYGGDSFDLITARVAPHHFGSPERFVQETARVLKPGGHFLLIDCDVPDDDPETEDWLHRVEKWRDPSYIRFLSRKSWEELVRGASMNVVHSELHLHMQPDLQWYFDTAATTSENQARVLEAVATASEHVRKALLLGNEEGKIIWWWPMLVMLAAKSE
jgi:SAM-dependent methyltransferase